MSWMWGKILDFLGLLVGLAELAGLKYPVRHYQEAVDDNLWRGSRVGLSEIKQLQKDGFRMIVNLCAENNTDAELVHGSKVEIVPLRIPVVDNTAPTNDQVFRFLRYATNPSYCKLFVHCEAGVGRTSLFVAAYRMCVSEWSCSHALQEAIDHGMKMECQEKFIKSFYVDYVAGGGWKDAMHLPEID